ncbi:2OG-Fe(II) oxygenase family protein [Agarilytica rhodophyticola]|uniref:2OG-Fe(II) oxygenase family protein n=1 Tax=Agarilytica rhodophyticola TaxID=1737490 RepID=UPI000B3445EB|nr:2OG-Fe(II) oxygenase family protein [Agarilytica rhodophyticola]
MVSLTELNKARNLELPTREDMLHRAPSVQQFWEKNNTLFVEAWKQWEQSAEQNLVTLDDSLLDARLREAILAAWENPTKELAVRDLWHEVSPDVYQCQFFDPERLTDLRSYLDSASDASIPLRPPYGIVLNRAGMMLDRRSPGYLAAPGFQSFYNSLMDKFVRPTARLLFPEITGYDTQTFGFSIRYQPSTDTSIQPHTDASSITLNINLNLPNEIFDGSAVDFLNSTNGEVNQFTFAPGVAVMHRGHIPHAARSITNGERTNMVLWLYGDRGQIAHNVKQTPSLSADKRWSVPSSPKDQFAPF